MLELPDGVLVASGTRVGERLERRASEPHAAAGEGQPGSVGTLRRRPPDGRPDDP